MHQLLVIASAAAFIAIVILVARLVSVKGSPGAKDIASRWLSKAHDRPGERALSRLGWGLFLGGSLGALLELTVGDGHIDPAGWILLPALCAIGAGILWFTGP